MLVLEAVQYTIKLQFNLRVLNIHLYYLYGDILFLEANVNLGTLIQTLAQNTQRMWETNGWNGFTVMGIESVALCSSYTHWELTDWAQEWGVML